MHCFGNSNLDAFISLLLVETAWWGSTLALLVKHALPFWISCISISFRSPAAFVLFLVLVVILFRCLAPSILWYSILSNKEERTFRIIKIWSWTSIALDMVVLVLAAMFCLDGWRMLTIGISFLILRSGFWIWTSSLSSQLRETNEKAPLFPAGFISYIWQVKRLITIILTWEALWYSIRLLTALILIIVPYYNGLIQLLDSFIGASRDLRFAFLFPGLDSTVLDDILFNSVAVAVSLIHLTGVFKDWKLFLKFWVGVYAVFNVIGYGYLHGMVLMWMSFYPDRDMSLAFAYTFWGIEALLPAIALLLKLCVLLGTLKLICKQAETDEAKGSEDKSLIAPLQNH